MAFRKFTSCVVFRICVPLCACRPCLISVETFLKASEGHIQLLEYWCAGVRPGECGHHSSRSRRHV